MTAAAQGRVQVIDVPIALPGKCVICGYVGGDGRKFVDFNWQMDWYGAIIFCENCMTEVMETINYVHEDKYNKLALEHKELTEKLLSLEKVNQELKNVLRDAFGIDSDKLDSYPSDSVVLSDSDEITEAEPGITEPTDLDNAFAVEPASEQGSGDVSEPATKPSKPRNSSGSKKPPAEPSLSF